MRYNVVRTIGAISAKEFSFDARYAATVWVRLGNGILQPAATRRRLNARPNPCPSTALVILLAGETTT
jgi:hypothetical protein